jgi:predicted secreted Zn-dependent protease
MTGGDRDGLTWRKSSYSSGGGECVETAVLPDRRVAVRDSKHPADAVLIYAPAEWRAFIAGANAGEFDPA